MHKSAASEAIEMLAAELRSSPTVSPKTLKLLETLEATDWLKLKLWSLVFFARSIWQTILRAALPIWAAYMVQLFFGVPVLNQWGFLFVVALLALGVFYVSKFLCLSLLNRMPKLFEQVTASYEEDNSPQPRHGLHLLPQPQHIQHTFSGSQEPPIDC